MKKNEKKSLGAKSQVQLRQLEIDVVRDISILRVKRFTEQQKNTRASRGLRTKIAVIKTMVRASELGGAQ